MTILSNTSIKEKSREFGFFACGMAQALPVDKDIAENYRKWLENGYEANMTYMANFIEKRLDPKLLVPNVKTIISVALNYSPAQTLPKEQFQFASYALGKDYHKLMKERLREFAQAISPIPLPNKHTLLEEQSIRCFCDTGPVLERYWAYKAGIGWIGRNHQLIIPHAGSMFFLGEVFLPFEVDQYDSPKPNRCGKCHRCIDACPTKAISIDKDFDSEKCLSYQLIENREQLSEQAKQTMGTTIYGCDRCQTVCPWNKFSTPTEEPSLQPKPELIAMRKEDWLNLSLEDYQTLFKGSAVKRVKYNGLIRNIQAANNKTKDNL